MNEADEMREIEDKGRPVDDEVVIAWLAGELGPAESLALMKRMMDDAELRERAERTAEALEAAREWLGEAAPGVERVERLAIPKLGGGEVVARREWARGWPGGKLARALAAVLIFAVGILIGGVGMRQAGTRMERMRRPAEDGRVQAALTPVPTPMPVVVAPTLASAPAPKPPLAEPTPAPARPRPRPARTVHEEDGKVVIETELADSGGRAIWVVDGGFQVASGK